MVPLPGHKLASHTPIGYAGGVPRPAIGRDPELDAIATGLTRRPGMLNAVVVEGPAGIGKTSVLREASAQLLGDRHGVVKLKAEPLRSERDLVFSTLGDLFGQLASDALCGLPEVQQTALDAALLRDTATAPPTQSGGVRLVGTAVRTVLTRLAEAGNVLMMIDDVQWADEASVAALRFALHRLGEANVDVLLANRNHADPLELDQGTEPRLSYVPLGPLDKERIFAIVRDHLGLTLAVPTLAWVTERSGGNPLYALELARAISASPVQVAEDFLPDSLSGLMDARLAGTPPEWGDTLLTLALSRHISTDELSDIVPGALDVVGAAQQVGLVEWRGHNVQFVHPLLASAVVRRAAPPARRAAHQRLAAASLDPENRARHLALAATGPDEAIAEALAGAAVLAAARGATAQAAELMGLARSATPLNYRDKSHERALQQADFLERAGDVKASEALLAEVKDQASDNTLRARAIELYVRTAVVATGTLSGVDAIPMLDEALELTDDEQVRALIHGTRGSFAGAFDLDQAIADYRTALDLFDSIPDPDPYMFVETAISLTLVRFLRHGEFDEELVERALAVERVHPNPQVGERCAVTLGRILRDRGQFAEARVFLMDSYQSAVAEGAYESLPFIVGFLPQLELWSGRPDQAETWAREQITLSEQTGHTLQRLQGLANLAEVLTHLDRLDEASGALREAESLAVACDPMWADRHLAGRRGLLALARGDDAAGIDAFRHAAVVADSAGWTLPLRTDIELAETLVNSGALAEAAEVVDRLESAARRVGHHSLTGAALTVRATLAATEQRLDAAGDLMVQGYAELELGEEPFLLGRAKLAEARLLRRRRERKAAVDAFGEAEALFTQVGAAGWARAAAADRSQTPIRPGSPGLTETESRIADLVARGLTNAQIAADQFISVKTVETHLTRIYTKLGVRSRAQLTRHLAEQDRG